ncbi:MAG: hypothetical protein M3323_02485 [Actinomycetota bacterium]|nr:hypothetical protein [Actinomycetota bacterium]
MGATLVEPVALEADGETASIAVDNVTAFSPGGGAAVFEPGTAGAESFLYTTVDAETNRLVGLTRPSPAEHASGAFVASTPPPPSDTSQTPANQTEADPIESATQEPVAPVSTPPPDGTPDATIEDALGNPVGLVELECGEASCAGDDALGMIGFTCEAEACEAADDPLGTWSVCDFEDSGETCPDPEDVIDLLWDTDAGLTDLECEASVTGPSISNGGGMVVGRGSFECGEYVSWAKITVCLYRAIAGGWTKMGCREKQKMTGAGALGNVSKKIAEPCTSQQTSKFRIRARGWAVDGGGPGEIDEDRDSASATAKLYCPGTSLEGAASDATVYAESWLPEDE